MASAAKQEHEQGEGHSQRVPSSSTVAEKRGCDDYVSFVRDNMTNTQIISSDQRVLYTVESDKMQAGQTRVFRRDSSELVATVVRKSILPDQIKFGERRATRLSSWLRGASRKWTDFPVSFEWDYTQFTWKPMGVLIGLYPSQSPDAPLAWFERSHSEVIDGIPTILRARLMLQHEAIPVLDGIVVSLLVVEQRLRLAGDKRAADRPTQR